ncbi:AAA family ATPase [Chryseobacterium sp.]|uniref:AAA family ATPase n=1 Tax=Chryseobacterium sp. TaxID=1871047 RepID=UPI00289EA9D3|nr:AAA family ATPase [Chryseobacterium sp.]
MESIEREAFKVFYVSNHGLGAHNIYERISERGDTRTLATPRLLGILNPNLSLSEVGELFMSTCSDRQRILKNQYKKWHFPNSVAYKGEAISFSIYPYWIIVEFLVLAAKNNILFITNIEFIVFIATIRSRSKILEHFKVLEFLRNNNAYNDEFYNQIPDNENLFLRFSKSGFHELLGDCLEYLSYDTKHQHAYLSTTDYEFLINSVNYFYSTYDIYSEFGKFSPYTQNFLSKLIIDNTFNIFPMSNSFTPEAYKSVSQNINNSYPFLNLLLKGVPGTGKSHLIEEILNKEIFGIQDGKTEDDCLKTSVLKNKNVVRLNIHSGLSNAELMQGIGVTTTGENEIKYYEKRGLILKHIAKAILNPSLPYVIILEEIQENNLNKLIGDLIFLIEDSRRVSFADDHYDLLDSEIDFAMVSEIVVGNAEHNKVALPSLIEDSQELVICLPKNLYFFCTSNYRDDKKIMEDNLLRRFEIIDLFPNSSTIRNEKVKGFFEKLNESVFQFFSDNLETHPDRYLIGHVIWMHVNDLKTFLQAFNKVVVDMKDLKDIDWNSFNQIILGTGLDMSNYTSYQQLSFDIQNHIYKAIDFPENKLKSSLVPFFV